MPSNEQATRSPASILQETGPALPCLPANPSTTFASTPFGSSSRSFTGVADPSTGASPRLVTVRTRRPLPPGETILSLAPPIGSPGPSSAGVTDNGGTAPLLVRTNLPLPTGPPVTLTAPAPRIVLSRISNCSAVSVGWKPVVNSQARTPIGPCTPKHPTGVPSISTLIAATSSPNTSMSSVSISTTPSSGSHRFDGRLPACTCHQGAGAAEATEAGKATTAIPTSVNRDRAPLFSILLNSFVNPNSRRFNLLGCLIVTALRWGRWVDGASGFYGAFGERIAPFLCDVPSVCLSGSLFFLASGCPHRRRQ